MCLFRGSVRWGYVSVRWVCKVGICVCEVGL